MKKTKTSYLLKGTPSVLLVLGAGFVMASSADIRAALGMGAAVLISMLLSSIVISALHKIIPNYAKLPAYLMIITGKKDDDEDEKPFKETKHPLKESIGNIIWVIGLIAYFGISFLSGAWHITWLIFPIMACARGLSDAIIDLMEVKK